MFVKVKGIVYNTNNIDMINIVLDDYLDGHDCWAVKVQFTHTSHKIPCSSYEEAEEIELALTGGVLNA